MSLTSVQLSVKYRFEQELKATSRGGTVMMRQGAQKLGFYRYVAENLPAGRLRDVVVQLVAGLSLGGHGQASADLIANDSDLSKVVGLGCVVGEKRVYPTLVALAGRSTRSKAEKTEAAVELSRFRALEEARKEKEKETKKKKAKETESGENNNCEKVKRKNSAKSARQRREQAPPLPGLEPVASQKPMPLSAVEAAIQSAARSDSGEVPTLDWKKDAWTSEAAGRMENLNLQVLRSAVGMSKAAVLELLKYYRLFLDGSLLETEGKRNPMAAIDRKGKLSVLFMGLWLGPYLLAWELFPGNTEEGSVAVALLEKGRRNLAALGIGPEKTLLLADSAYGQKHVLDYLDANKFNYIVGMNRLRAELEKKANEFAKKYWTESSAPSRDNQEESFCDFSYAAKGWTQNITVIASKYIKKGELLEQVSFLTSNLEKNVLAKLSTGPQPESYFANIWNLYSIKQGSENYQKDFLIDLGMHHPSSSRVCVNQVLYSIASLALNINAFISHNALPEAFKNARIWRIAATLYTIPARVSIRSRYILVELATSISPKIQAIFISAMTFLAKC